MYRTLALAAVGISFVLGPIAARADEILYVSDASDHIGQLDLTTHQVSAGSVHFTGQALTDIAFNSSGTLYGTTFTNLYTISPTTGAASAVGAAYSGTSGMNALIGSGTNLLGAAFTSNTIFTINATNAALTTFSSGIAPSAGDLAFSGVTLYESATANNGNNELVNVTAGTVIGTFHVGSAAGATLTNLFGLSNDGTTTFAIAGTEVYSVDLGTAILTPLFDYSTAENGQNLTAATGSAFINEATTPPTSTPEPATLLVLSSALAGLGVLRMRG